MTTGSVLAQFTITLSQAVSEQVAVEWHTADGSALAGVDYASAKGTVLFAPGQTSKTVDILVYGRAVGSEDRSFFVEMLPPVNAILGASIGECIIHVDTTGSTPVTQVIVPTGPQGVDGKSAYQVWLDLGNTGTEQDFIDSLSPSPEEIAIEVAPLLDMGESPVTAEGTDTLSTPDAMKLKELARRVAYAGATKISTVMLASGDNLLSPSDLTGDAVDFSSICLYPRISRGSAMIAPEWNLEGDGRLLVKGAIAGDVLYLCQYDLLSDQAVRPIERLANEAMRRGYAEAGYTLRPETESFELGGTLSSSTDVLLRHNTGKAYSAIGPFPRDVTPGTDPTSSADFTDQSGKLLKTALAAKHGSLMVGEADTAIELQAMAGVEFARVKTLGYTTKGDGGSAEYEVSSTLAFGGLTLPNGLFANPVNLTSPRQIGWTTAGGQANYDLMAAFVNAGKASPGRYKTLLTLHRIYAEWLAGRGCPLAFYGDSTTDGATTTGHAASVANGLTWSSTVTINASPNSYPNVLKTWCAKNAPAAKIYNAGFDSTSLRDDTGSYGDEFGNKFFHRVFFGYPTYNNVDFRDVKAIALSWGTSDSINLNDVNTIISSYEWKMELLIVECFERGIQPIINHPVLNTQRRGSLVNGRDNDESISIVQAINERLAKKYNLEVISLHDALYSYVNDNDGRDGDYLKVLAVDGVHPNDMGHRQIAGWMYSRINPMVKTVSPGEKFVVSACSPYEYTVPALNGAGIWLAYDRTQLISDQSYFHRFTPSIANEFFIRFYVYCEQPCDLSYSGLMDNNSIVTDFNKVPKVLVKNVASDITRISELWSDYQAVYTTLTTTSSQLLGRLDVGLNEVEVVAPNTLGLRASFDFGAFLVKPRSRRCVTKEFLSGVGSNIFRAEMSTSFGEIMYPSSAVSGVIWCDSKFEDASYYTGRVATENTITFKANYLKNRSVYWAANRRYKEFDSYNKLSISGTTVVLSVVLPNMSGTPVENIIATMVSSYDFTAISPYETISITVNNKADGSIEFYLRKLNKTTAVFDTLCSTTMASASTSRIFQHGYSFGASKSVVDGIHMHITDITINSNT